MGLVLGVLAALSGLGDLVREILTTMYKYGKPWVLVEHWENAIIQRWGVYHRKRGPGIWLKIPIFENDVTANVKPDTMDIEPISITTLDGKTISIGCILYYQVFDVKLFLADHNDSPSNMRDLARGEMSDIIEELNWDETKKKGTKTKVKNKLDDHFRKMGVELQDFKFSDKAQARALKIFTSDKKTKQTLL